MWDYYEPVESLFSKEFKMESLSRSKQFKDDKNKILNVATKSLSFLRAPNLAELHLNFYTCN